MSRGAAARNAVGGVPVVDLMPPEVAQHRRDQSMRSWALVGLVIVSGLAVVGTALAAFSNSIAQAGLVGAQAQTQVLLSQQQQYADVTTLTTSISFAEQARVVSVSKEVLWLDVQREVLAAVPAGATVSSLSASSDSPWTNSMAVTDPLRPARVATVSVTLVTPSLAEVTAYVTALQGNDLVADVTADSVVLAEGYSTMLTINIDALALSKRFTDDYLPRGSASADATPTPEPTPTPDGTDAPEDNG